MIERYTLPEMAEIWSEEHKAKLWLEVELKAVEAMVKEGTVPKEALNIRSNASINIQRAKEIEEEVKHDVIAFLTSVTENVGPEARFLHRGMTSNDLLDTSLAVQLNEASELILKELNTLLDVLWNKSNKWKEVPCIGRSHGIHAEPTTFGIKVLGWHQELLRRKDLFARAKELVSVGKIAGAVGTYSSISPEVESSVLSQFGLKRESVPTQVVQRDRHAEFFNALAMIGSSVERMAVELRHLQRTEVREVEEGFAKGQKGSSAMPHKKNPISAENITGLARLLRGYALSAIENVPLWHERDISHSSVERVICPDATIVAHYMIRRTAKLIEGLVINEEQMLENLNYTKGVVFSGAVLLALADRGMKREDAYKVVQEDAFKSLSSSETLYEIMSKNEKISKFLNKEDLFKLFDVKHHLRNIQYIFKEAKKH